MDVPGILVTSGKGGVGKTLLTTNLAQELSKHMRVALLDCDIRAPNLTYVMGISSVSMELETHNRLKPYKYSDNLEVFSTDHFFNRTDGKKKSILMSGSEIQQMVTDAIESVAWSEPEIFVMDSDPSTGDVFMSLRRTFLDMLNAVIVTTNDVSSLFDCERTIDALEHSDIPILAVVGNLVFDGEDDRIKELTKKFGLRYAGYIPFDNEVRKANNDGKPGLTDSDVIKNIVKGIIG